MIRNHWYGETIPRPKAGKNQGTYFIFLTYLLTETILQFLSEVLYETRIPDQCDICKKIKAIFKVHKIENKIWILIWRSKEKRIPYHCEMCDRMFFLTVSCEGSLNRKQDINSSQLLLVAAFINELLATYLTMIWNCLYRNLVLFLIFKASCWNEVCITYGIII